MAIYFSIFIILSVLFFFEYGFALVLKYFYLSRLKKYCKKKLVLTYDDGPSFRLEERLLELLDKHGIKANFFLNAKTAELNPERCEVLKKAGHELGYHAYKHFYPWHKMPWQVWADFEKAYFLLKKWLPKKKLFRFPYGKFTTSVLIGLISKGTKIAFWTIDSGDSYSILPSKKAVIDNFLKEGGGVVLMHSFDRKQETIYKEDYVVDLTELLIKTAQKQRWEICTFSEMLDIQLHREIKH